MVICSSFLRALPLPILALPSLSNSCVHWSLGSCRFLIPSIMASLKERVENNFKTTDYYITDIQKKLEELAQARHDQPAPVEQLQCCKNANDLDNECEKLKAEIEEWKELLTIQQIMNGRKFVRYSTKANESNTVVNGATAAEATPRTKPADQQGAAQGSGDCPEKKPDNSQGDSNSNSNKPTDKKEKQPKEGKGKGSKEQQGKGGGGSASSAAEEVVDISRLDLRIGKIVQIEKHPDADSLYLEKIEVGEANPRTVVSGLVKHVSIEEMQDRMVVLLCNLKPAKMRGVTSEAMVMCASSPDKVEVLIPPLGVVPGDLVEFEGFVRNPDPVLNPKKKIFETVAPDLKTNDEKVATYKGIPFTVTGKGVVTSDTLTNVNIK